MENQNEKLNNLFTRLKEKKEKEILPHHLIFAFFSQLKKTRIKGESAGLHWFFYNLKKKHPDLTQIDKFFFKYSEGDPFPICDLIEKTISVLGLSESPIIHRFNPVFNIWGIDSVDIRKFKVAFDKFDEGTQEIILRNATDFNNYL